MIFNKKAEADLFDFLFIVIFGILFYIFMGFTLSAGANSAYDNTLSMIKQREAEQLLMSYLSAPLDPEGNRVLDLISRGKYDLWEEKSNEFFKDRNICVKITVPPEEELPENLRGDNSETRKIVEGYPQYQEHPFKYCPNTKDGEKMNNLLNSGKNPAGYNGNILEISFIYQYGEFEINSIINKESKPITFQYVIEK
jgi:hypothetical protein